MKPFSNKIALVTGASRGIGAALAKALATAGAHVVLVGRTEGALEEVEANIHSSGGTATIAPMDITAPDTIERLSQAVASRWGLLDLLVLNAGVLGPLSPVGHVSPKDWDQVLATNLTANWRFVRAFDPLLRTSEAGRLLALTSSVARKTQAYWGAYAASKAGLETLLQTYAEETRNVSRVRAAIVNPGGTRTKMRAQAFPGEDPLKLPKPEQVADAIMDFLGRDFDSGAFLDLKGRLTPIL
jgi:NAD(P)-dependent dehydrogenase (short-subunit alcohol dehydrogenase family)